MPYQITSQCGACGQSDSFIIGNWPEHLGVYICLTCKALVNIPVESGKCPGCGYAPQPDELYDYTLSIPYLGGQTPRPLEPGPACPKCQDQALTFANTIHLNLGSVVFNEEKALSSWGRDYMEKAIFMNSTIPVIQEFGLSPMKVFEYFHVHLPSAPLITRRMSYPIALDIRTHLMIRVMTEPQRFKDVPNLGAN